MRLVKRVASLMIAVMLIVSGGVADMTVDKVSAATVVEIYDEGDWNDFADSVNGGESELSAVLMADFTATSDFIQINEMFSGTFDGNGHTITGLTTSMFDYVQDGTVQNLTVKEVAIEEYVGWYSVGAIVDDLYGGSVVNCVVESGYIDVYGSVVGGVVGAVYEDASVSGCVNGADISADSEVGGIVGYVYSGSVYDCSNTGNITASVEMAGGIAGNISPDSAGIVQVYGSYNAGTIYAPEYSGGIAGQIMTQQAQIMIHSVYNTGNISGNSCVGGIAGIATADSADDKISISNAYNSGNISGTIIAGAIVGGVQSYNSSSIVTTNVIYVKDDTINSDIYVTGSASSDTCAYSLADITSGKVAYDMNNYSSFDSEWSYWAYDGSDIVLASDDSAKAYKITYMNNGSELKTVYSLNTGLYEVMDSPADVNGSLFAGWFTEDLGIIETVTEDTLRSAVDFSAGAISDLILYPVYLSTGTVEEDPSDTSNSVKYDNSGLYLQGAQIREPNTTTGVTAGLRFITRISTSLIANVEALNEANASLRPETNADKEIGYGTVVTAKSNITDGDMLVKDLSAASAMRGMYVAPAVINYKEYDGYILYTALVVGIPEAYYTTDIAARPYITYCDANGVERTYYYVETSSSSVAGGAYYTSYQKVYNYIYGTN